MTRKILVAACDPEMGGLLAECLRRRGFQAALSLDGETAGLVARQYRPDLIVLHYRLPEDFGVVAYRGLKLHPGTAHIPLMLLSSVDWDEDERRALRADSYLSLPFTPEELHEAVNELLSRKAA